MALDSFNADPSDESAPKSPVKPWEEAGAGNARAAAGNAEDVYGSSEELTAEGKEGQGQGRPRCALALEEPKHPGPAGTSSTAERLRQRWEGAGEQQGSTRGDGLTDSAWHGGAEAEEGAGEIRWEGAPFPGLKEHALRLRESSSLREGAGATERGACTLLIN